MSVAPKTCALDGCEESFVSSNARKRFCSPTHARAADNVSRRTTAPTPEPKTLDEVVEGATAKDEQRRHAAELRKIVSLEQRQRRLEAVLSDALSAYEATPLVIEHPKPRPRRLPVHEDVLVTSDWHIGELVTLEQTGAIYQQTVATTRAQVARIWESVKRLHEVQSSGSHVRKLHHLFLGDLVESDVMRASQHRKIEDVVTVQAVQGIDLLAWLIRQELTIYEEVEVELVGGNHDRVSQKPGDGGLGELSYVDNFTWLAGAMLERLFATDIKSGRLKIRNWTTFFGYKLVAGMKLVFEHGSSFKWNVGSYGGVPWYAVSQLSPKYAAMLGGADLICIGHGHRPVVIPSGRGYTVANGALPATSTYAQAGFKVVSRPLQWKLSVHEEHGVIGFIPIYCDVPGTLSPGMIWEDPDHYASLASGKADAVDLLGPAALAG